jgi:hypothetical protein
MENDNQGFYQGSFVRFLGFRVEKLFSLVSFFIMNDFDVSGCVRTLRSYLGKMWAKFLKFPVVAKLDLIFKW